VDALCFDKGRIWPQRQWYLGYLALLAQIKQQLADCPPHRLMNHPDDIAIMFDKRRTHELLARNEKPVPRALQADKLIGSYEELLDAMKETGWRRVFIKMAHGSSASGVVAYQIGGLHNEMHSATTTVEVVQASGELRLYNSLRPHTYRSQQEIAQIVDVLCQHRVHVEEWVPKAGIAGKTFDLRVLVIGGKAQHTVVRTSRGPMTNLHLGNARGDLEPVRVRMGESHWQAARNTCEQVASCFAQSLYVGIDLLISTNFRDHAILEANAFGDLLPRLEYEGRNTYETEILAVLRSDRANPNGSTGTPSTRTS
jgi:glutathione synthase/RimK-type ligase-like ATP-grasp enzyme